MATAVVSVMAPFVFQPMPILIALGVVAALAVAFLVYSLVKSKAGSLPAFGKGATASLHGLLNSPVLSLVATKVAQQAHDNGHAVLDAMVARMFPGVAALAVPVVNAAADMADAKLGANVPAVDVQAIVAAVVQQLKAGK